MEPRERLLPLVGAYNFRDLGGYPTNDGRVTRWGKLFRSDTLHELTEADLKVLRDVGLATIIDLRMPSAASGNVCALYQLTQCLVLSVAVAPDDVATDHRVLFFV